MAEVHVVGSLVGAEDFDESSLFCKWSIITDDGRTDNKRWNLLEGVAAGQTQVDVAKGGTMAVWSFPLDLHYSTSTIHGWPKFQCEVWSHDSYGRNSLAGYGFCHIPSAPGMYELSICTWRPKPQSWLDYINGFFLGAYPQLKNPDIVWKQDDRYRLYTVAAGTVKLQVSVVTFGFEKQGVSQFSDPNA
mmetsp:Transcript_7657/g.12155  ORF Transcript_7657/g.12155 Transcript_7657/m.12155 type:complete len:189 (+) Transcript_7657:119-685(+)|eukprot:CAMPEP_0184327024 /NCGR_PEP_ID=MMETSP1049-20130417/142876_1 /TAXON_ID=77928 /ORGANISM="Proteomonas sulcata, Strain CCMP704" /LENGTH=188 /DNA_ID=CAMNT_0026649257 /DNA_START=104 /DNA_END=670 /DNA_ORIENTATION=+